MKKKFLTLLVTAGALTVVNCGTYATDAVSDAITNNLPGDTTMVITPVVDPATGLPVVDPVTGEQVMDTSIVVTPSDSATNAGDGTPAGDTSLVITPVVDPATGEPVLDPVTGEQVMDTSVVVTPADPGTNPIDPGTTPTDPGTTPVVSSTSVEPAVTSSSSKVAPESSSVEAKPESSSSEVKPASSSSEVKPVSSSSEPVVENKPGIFLSENGDENKDQMEVVYQTRTGDNGGGVLAYPKNLSSTQKHGVVLWGPGGGTEPTAYEGIIRRLASQGFVVVGLKESPGDASQAMKAIDWLEKKNQNSSDIFYNKLDMTKVGCSGHSMGGLESEQAVIKDKRVITAFMNNSGDRNGGGNGAVKVPKEKTIAILYGEVGMERQNAIADYNYNGVQAGACLIEMNGGPQNSEGGYGHGSGSWDGKAATVAWMRWHLGGEDKRKADFVGTSGKYINGPVILDGGKTQGNWKTQCKNF